MTPYSPEVLISLVDALAADVTNADTAELSERRRLTQLWLSNPVVLELITDGLESFSTDVQEYIGLLAVGVAGLARTLQVGANQEIMPIAEAERQGKFSQVDQALANVNLAISTHYKLRTEELAPWTIHSSNPIDWAGEVAQDLGATYEKLGKNEFALEVLEVALYRTNEKLSAMEAAGLPNLQAPIDPKNSAELKRRNSYVGAISVKGVLQYRVARVIKSMSGLTEALHTLNQAHALHPNPDRLKAVLKHATKAIFEKEYTGTVREKVQLVAEVCKSLLVLSRDSLRFRRK